MSGKGKAPTSSGTEPRSRSSKANLTSDSSLHASRRRDSFSVRLRTQARLVYSSQSAVLTATCVKVATRLASELALQVRIKRATVNRDFRG